MKNKEMIFGFKGADVRDNVIYAGPYPPHPCVQPILLKILHMDGVDWNKQPNKPKWNIAKRPID